MCFTVRKNQSQQIATEDITCYKMFKDPEYFSVPDGIFRSPFQSFDYEKGKRYDLGKELNIIEDEIDEGFHSYIRETAAIMAVAAVGREVAICIIPKGSKYYIDPVKEEYVSDSIIIGIKFIK